MRGGSEPVTLGCRRSFFRSTVGELENGDALVALSRNTADPRTR
jgi:hypothetical protein